MFLLRPDGYKLLVLLTFLCVGFLFLHFFCIEYNLSIHLVISCHLLFLSKFVRYLRRKTVSHRQYVNLASLKHLVYKEPSGL